MTGSLKSFASEVGRQARNSDFEDERQLVADSLFTSLHMAAHSKEAEISAAEISAAEMSFEAEISAAFDVNPVILKDRTAVSAAQSTAQAHHTLRVTDATHHTLRVTDATDVDEMIDAINSKTAKQKDENGDRPIHHACKCKVQAKVTIKLIEVWPESTKERDGKGWLPIHIACKSKAPAAVMIERFTFVCTGNGEGLGVGLAR